MMRLFGAIGRLLDARGRREAWLVGVAMVVGALFEAVGVGLVVPFIAVLTAPERVDDLPLISSVASSLGGASSRHFAITAGVALVMVFVAKNLWIAWQTHLQFRFAYTNQVRLARRLLHAYLHAPHALHVRRNSMDLLRVLNQDCLWVFNHVVVPLLTIASELIVVVTIGAVLMWFAPAATLLVAAIFGATSLVFFAWVRRRLRALGAVQQREVGAMMRTVREALGAIKETRTGGREAFFVDAYARSGFAYVDANTWMKSVGAMPRVFVETIGVAAVMGFALWSIARDADAATLLPTLGLFAMAAIRLMPSFNRIVTSATGLRFYLPAVDAVLADMPLVERLDGDASATANNDDRRPTIRLQSLSVRFDETSPCAIDDLTIEFAAGEIVGIVGPSGAGKTTLVDVLLGLVQPTSGAVLIDGETLRGPLRGSGVRVGYVPQAVFIRDSDVRHNVAFGVADEQIDDERVWHALRLAQLDDVVRALPRGLDESLGEGGTRLSGGQRQRIGVARALYDDPAVLVLDEATAALDTETERELSRAILELRGTRTIFVIAHRLSTVRGCDRIVVLRDGRVEADGRWDDVLRASPTLRALLDADTREVGAD